MFFKIKKEEDGYNLYKSLAASRSTFFSVNTRIQFSMSLGRIITLAELLLAKEYIYSIKPLH